MTALLNGIAFVIVSVGLGVANALLFGWAACTLWAWFIVPAFGLPQLSVLAAVGVGLVVKLFTIDLTVNRTDPKKPKGAWGQMFYSACMSAVLSLVAVGMGAIVHLFM